MSYDNLSIKDLYFKYEELTALSKMNLNSIPINVRSGREGQVRAAAAESAKVARAYREKVTENAVIIAVSGEYSKQFADESSNSLDMIALNYMKAADETAVKVIKRGYPDRYDSRTFHMALDEIILLKNYCGIFSLPTVQQIETTAFMTLQEGLRQSIKKSFQGQFYTLVTKNDIGLVALNNAFTGGKIPVVLYNYDKETPIDQTFLPVPLVNLEINDEKECTAENVKKKIQEIQSNFKKSNATETINNTKKKKRG